MPSNAFHFLAARGSDNAVDARSMRDWAVSASFRMSTSEGICKQLGIGDQWLKPIVSKECKNLFPQTSHPCLGIWKLEAGVGILPFHFAYFGLGQLTDLKPPIRNQTSGIHAAEPIRVGGEIIIILMFAFALGLFFRYRLIVASYCVAVTRFFKVPDFIEHMQIDPTLDSIGTRISRSL